MSTININEIMKEQREIELFNSEMYGAMEYIADAKGLLVNQKLEIIEELRRVQRDTTYGWHIVSGSFQRVPFSDNEKQFDNADHRPMMLAKQFESRYRAMRAAA